MATTVNIEYLIPLVRTLIGDLTPSSYRYIDEWIISSLGLAIRVLNLKWKYKYLPSGDQLVYRNPDAPNFTFEETDGVVESSDEYLMALQAAIIILGGSLENSSWDYSSWKDAEISYTNQESSKSRNANLKRLIDEMNTLITSPNKKLAQAVKMSLPGYKNNEYETED
jgi:hypothetical protein